MKTKITLDFLNGEASRIWGEFCEIFPELVKFDPPAIVLNNRFTVTAGVCHVEKNIIHLGSKFFPKHSANMLAVILPHEIAHQIDFNLYGMPKNNRWHGKTWQKIMVKYGLEPDTYHSMEL